MKVTKRLNNGLSGGLGYSWSKNLGTITSTGTYTVAMPVQDPSRAAQEREILRGHRPAADAQLLLQLRGAAIQLLAKRLEAPPAFGLDDRRHLPLPERFSDANTEFDEHSDFGDFRQW